MSQDVAVVGDEEGVAVRTQLRKRRKRKDIRMLSKC